MDWKREIVVAHMVKQKTAEVDVTGIWSYHFPEVAATEGTISSVERELGFRFDEHYRNFLGHADGWKAFYQAVDIFGASDFLGGPRKTRADELFVSLESLEDLCGFSRDELLPVAVSMDDVDLFVVTKPTSHEPGIVFWFACQVIDKFPDFDEWFLSMVDYNRRQYQKLVARNRQ